MGGVCLASSEISRTVLLSGALEASGAVRVVLDQPGSGTVSCTDARLHPCADACLWLQGEAVCQNRWEHAKRCVTARQCPEEVCQWKGRLILM